MYSTYFKNLDEYNKSCWITGPSRSWGRRQCRSTADRRKANLSLSTGCRGGGGLLADESLHVVLEVEDDCWSNFREDQNHKNASTWRSSILLPTGFVGGVLAGGLWVVVVVPSLKQSTRKWMIGILISFGVPAYFQWQKVSCREGSKKRCMKNSRSWPNFKGFLGILGDENHP